MPQEHPLQQLALAHPANEALRRRRERDYQPGRLPPLASPDAVPRPYESLGTHPELVEYLWDRLAGPLPPECRVIFLGAPALAHPVTGVVFGFAGGTRTCALRLPEPERAQALRSGATRVLRYPKSPAFDLDEIGPEWVFVAWQPDAAAWSLAAYRFAADAGAAG